jgi:hypothetical protein
VSVSREDASPSDEGTSAPSSSLATTSQEFADEEPERGEEVSGRATDALARAAIRDAMPCASRGEVWSPRVGEERPKSHFGQSRFENDKSTISDG